LFHAAYDQARLLFFISLPNGQWRIWGMAGMARAVGATARGAHKLLDKN